MYIDKMGSSLKIDEISGDCPRRPSFVQASLTSPPNLRPTPMAPPGAAQLQSATRAARDHTPIRGPWWGPRWLCPDGGGCGHLQRTGRRYPRCARGTASQLDVLKSTLGAPL